VDDEVTVLTGVIVSPEAATADALEAAVLGRVRILRTLTYYPSEPELTRFIQATGPAMVFLTTEELDRAIGLALAIDRSGTGTQVIAVDRSCDPNVLVEIMRAGIREFLSLPIDSERLAEALARVADVLARKPLAFKSTEEVYSFLPAKPGDGTSTVALNASAAIARRSRGRTLIVDFDLNLGMISFLLKITNGRSVLDAVSVADTLDSAIWDNLVLKRDELDVLCSGRLDARNTLNPAQVEKVLYFVKRTYDSICLDLSGNMEPYSIEILHHSKEIFVVCTSDIPSLHFARAKTEFLRSAGFEDRISVLLNRSEKRSAFSIKDVEDMLGARVRFSFMNDPKRVSKAMEEGTYVDPKSELGRQFDAFADCLVGPKAADSQAAPKRRFVEYFAIVPSTYHAIEEKRR
jgi:pilus assembly protein CpaE